MIRTALCVDGNDTPVSMSESDTPTTLGVAPFFPAKTNQPAKNTNVIQERYIEYLRNMIFFNY